TDRSNSDDSAHRHRLLDDDGQPGLHDDALSPSLGEEHDRGSHWLSGVGTFLDPENRGHSDMTPAALLIVFFLFTLGAVSAAGYVFVFRPRATVAEADI